MAFGEEEGESNLAEVGTPSGEIRASFQNKMNKSKSLVIELEDLRAEVKKAKKEKDMPAIKQFRDRIHDIVKSSTHHSL